MKYLALLLALSLPASAHEPRAPYNAALVEDVVSAIIFGLNDPKSGSRLECSDTKMNYLVHRIMAARLEGRPFAFWGMVQLVREEACKRKNK